MVGADCAAAAAEPCTARAATTTSSANLFSPAPRGGIRVERAGGPSIRRIGYLNPFFCLSQAALKFSETRLDVHFLLLALNNVVTIAPQEVVDRFNTDSDGTRGFVFIEILE